MSMLPETFDFNEKSGLCLQREPMRRHLRSMINMFYDTDAYDLLLKDNPLIYEFYDMDLPKKSSDLAFGTSICHPGKVGDEYYMTKGHFHQIEDTAEVYYCLSGHGLMMMETKEGEWTVKEMKPGRVVYVPGKWAHRSINIGNEPFVTFFTFRADAGHDYKTIEQSSFRKCVVERNGSYCLIDNPKWQASPKE